MGKGKAKEKLQDATLGSFSRTLRNHEITKNDPTFFELEVIRSKKQDEENPLPEAKPHISFYDPNNPLNGIFAKSLADQKEIAEKLKGSNPVRRTSSGPRQEQTVNVDPNITVVKAIYGASGHTIDCTRRIELGKKITNRMAGEDPIRNVKKTLSLTVTMPNGESRTKVFKEGELLIF